MNRIQVWSSGGGTQSCAIAALIVRGELRPDISVIVDTEREVSQTWQYHNAIIVPALAAVGVKIHRVEKSKYAKVDLLGGKNGNTVLLPVFSLHDGKQNKLPTRCSNEWKARVVQRFVRELMPKAKGFDIWLGISRDEAHRMKVGHTGKWQYRHPLIDNGRMMSRQDCISLIKSMGWPEPPRSRCWMCPNQSPREWKDLRDNYPAEYQQAMELEKRLHNIDATMKLEDPKGSQGSCMSGYCLL
jgi:hypothetical protein